MSPSPQRNLLSDVWWPIPYCMATPGLEMLPFHRESTRYDLEIYDMGAGKNNWEDCKKMLCSGLLPKPDSTISVLLKTVP